MRRLLMFIAALALTTPACGTSSPHTRGGVCTVLRAVTHASQIAEQAVCSNSPEGAE